jgi:predicted nuclease of predicted toxin-antitoxin system
LPPAANPSQKSPLLNMKLLLNANISWRLVARLKPFFEDCAHVDLIGLAVPAKDKDIWNYAIDFQMMIVTNDENYLDLVNLKGFPPKIILLRNPNHSSKFIENILIKHKADIEALSLSSDTGVLEIR